jgi:hypothetical protein
MEVHCISDKLISNFYDRLSWFDNLGITIPEVEIVVQTILYHFKFGYGWFVY